MLAWWPKHVASKFNNKILLCWAENKRIYYCRSIKCYADGIQPATVYQEQGENDAI